MPEKSEARHGPTPCKRVMLQEMARLTIIPGKHLMNPDVDPALTERYRPEKKVVRECDAVHRPSAYPQSRRFETIYPGTRAAEEAERAWMRDAMEHDRTALSGFVELLDDEITKDIVIK